MSCSIRLFLLSLFISSASFAQPTLKAVFVSKPPIIDGRLNEEVWENAAKVDQFIQREPNVGQPVSEKTNFYICYDADFLYV